MNDEEKEAFERMPLKLQSIVLRMSDEEQTAYLKRRIEHDKLLASKK